MIMKMMREILVKNIFVSIKNTNPTLGKNSHRDFICFLRGVTY